MRALGSPGAEGQGARRERRERRERELACVGQARWALLPARPSNNHSARQSLSRSCFTGEKVVAPRRKLLARNSRVGSGAVIQAWVAAKCEAGRCGLPPLVLLQ